MTREEETMANQENQQALQTTESEGLTEATRPGELVSPPVDIFESQQAITVLADMPGVEAGALTIDLHEGVLTITGHPRNVTQEGEIEVIREYQPATYQRKFALSEAIDQDRIEAQLVAGVLRLQLPKVDRARSRKVAVKAG